MGTSYTIKFRDAPSNLMPEKIQGDINALLDEINQSMSTYLADSELSRLNQNQDSVCIKISEELYEVIDHALYISQMTDGAFDITVGPLVDLWGFGPKAIPEQIPDDGLLAKIQENTGYELLSLDQQQQCVTKKKPDIAIDLSAIAKGYAVDQVSDLLDEMDISHYMIEIGGEIHAHGNNGQSNSWTIGIEAPTENERYVQRILVLSNSGMATSGDYRNYYAIDGQRYSHIIDPSTGQPIKHHLASATVIHDSTMTADALATAFIVLGPEASKKIIQRENIASHLIIRDNDEFTEWNSTAFSKHTLH